MILKTELKKLQASMQIPEKELYTEVGCNFYKTAEILISI